MVKRMREGMLRVVGWVWEDDLVDIFESESLNCFRDGGTTQSSVRKICCVCCCDTRRQWCGVCRVSSWIYLQQGSWKCVP